MSRYAKLIIDGKEADAFSVQELPLNLKQRISNSDGDAAGSFTRSTLKIPATKNNKAILDGRLDYLPFRIELNGATRLSGFLQVKKEIFTTDCYNCVVDAWEVNLQGGNADWFLALRECTLDELTDEQVVYSQANVLSGFNADPTLINYAFTFVKWREWENSRIASEDDGTGTGTIISRQLDTPSLFETTPIYFIRPLIIEAFRKIGYTVESEFFDTDFFRRQFLMLPLPDKMPEEYSEQFLNFRGSKDTLQITPATVIPFQYPYDVIVEPPQNPGVWDVILYEYTAPETGFYEVETGATYGPQVGTFSFIYAQIVTVNGIATPPYLGGAGFADGDLLGTSTFPTGESRKSSGVYQVNAGDKIAVSIITVTDTNFDILNNYVKITGEAIRVEGLTIDFPTLLSRYDFLPMFRDIILKYKLAIEPNPDSKVVKIEPSEPYRYTDRLTATDEVREGYYFINDPIDLSDKVDYKRKIEGKILDLEGFINFKYQSDDEETIRSIEENEKFAIYQAIFNSPNGTDKNKTKPIETEFFAKTIHVLDNIARYPDTNIQPQFMLIYPFDYVTDPTALPEDANFDVTPRFGYFGGQRGGIDGYIEIFETGLQTELPAAFMVNYNDVTGLDPNLSWSREIINNVSVPGLVENYHIHCLSRLKQRKSKKLSICLNSIDRDNFTFRNRVIIGGKRYIVLEVESVNPLQGQPDQFLLILDEFADQECIDAIDNTNLRGVVSLFII